MKKLGFQSSHSGVERLDLLDRLGLARLFQSYHSGVESVVIKSVGLHSEKFQSYHSGVERYCNHFQLFYPIDVSIVP